MLVYITIAELRGVPRSARAQKNFRLRGVSSRVEPQTNRDTSGWGGTPLYQVYRYVPPQRVWFLSRFGLKSGIDFEHFGLRLGMVIAGKFTKAYKLIFLPSYRGE